MNMDALKVQSLNTGIPSIEIFNGKGINTGTRKQPVTGTLYLTIEGFESDRVADLKHQGGKDRAVCVYSADHYS